MGNREVGNAELLQMVGRLHIDWQAAVSDRDRYLTALRQIAVERDNLKKRLEELEAALKGGEDDGR